MGGSSKPLNFVAIPEKPGNIGAKRESESEMDISAKKLKLAAAIPTNDGMKLMMASISEKKLPAATSLDKNSASKFIEAEGEIPSVKASASNEVKGEVPTVKASPSDEVVRENQTFKESTFDVEMTDVAAVPGTTQSSTLSKNDDIDDVHDEVGKSDQVHTDEPTEDCTASGESGKLDDEPEKKSKKRSKEKPMKQDDIGNDLEVSNPNQIHVDEPTKDCRAPGESGKIDDEPEKKSKMRSKRKSTKQPTEDCIAPRESGKIDDVPEKRSKKRSKKKSLKQAAEAIQLENKEDRSHKSPGSKVLFMGNLPHQISKDIIVGFFKDTGEIVDVRLAHDTKGHFMGFGLVEFADEVAVQKAIKKNREELMGREVNLGFDHKIGHEDGKDESQPFKEATKIKQSANKEDQTSGDNKPGFKTLAMRHLSKQISKDKIIEFFKDAGEIVDVRLVYDRKGCFKGMGFVDFADEASAKKAMKKNRETLMGRKLNLDFDSKCCTIFVEGFDQSKPLEEIRRLLREYFGSCGEVADVSTPTIGNGFRSQGFAFLDFKDGDAFAKALELDGTNLGNCTLTVQRYAPKFYSSGGGGGGGGGGFDGIGSRPDSFGGGDNFDSSNNGSGKNSGFGGCPGCDSIFCTKGAFRSGGSDGIGSRPDSSGGGDNFDSSNDGSGKNSGLGGCPGCDSIFCTKGAFRSGGSDGFNSGSGFHLGSGSFDSGGSGSGIQGRGGRGGFRGRRGGRGRH